MNKHACPTCGGEGDCPDCGKSKTRYTRGPWYRNIKPARKYPVIFAGKNVHIAQVMGDRLSDEEIEANCDLIVAAPRLHEALYELMQYVGGWDAPSNHPCGKARDLLKELEE